MALRDLKKHWLILLSVLSGLLLAAAWPARGFAGLLFIGFIPLLLVEEQIFRRRDSFVRFAPMFYSYPGFFTWNLLTTWWIVNSTLVGAAMAILINSLFMSAVFQAFHFTRKVLRSRLSGYVALVAYWTAFEYLHLNWSLNWPWLNLGNGFSTAYRWVEWYEYTGTLGGTIWVLVVNILLFNWISDTRSGIRETGLKHKFPLPYLTASILLMLLPVLGSYIMYFRYQETPDPVQVVVVQPNLDPYTEQYTLPPPQVLERIMNLASPLVDSSTNFLVAPESAIQEQMWENDLNSFYSIRMLQKYLEKYPDLNIIVGGSTFKYYTRPEQITNTARRFTDTNQYYDAYNAAIMLNRAYPLQLYHKSKLTPGVESLPSFRHFKWFEKFAINLGGTVGSLGTDPVRRVFRTVNAPPASAVICYESAFGEFFSEFVKNGARIMFIITNDGWWGNTGGYRQHFAFASLRAIETRRSIARSANTGISAFIDQRGDVHDRTGYWVPAAIRGTLNANSFLTFYTRNGDYLARIASGLTIIILAVTCVISLRRRSRGTRFPLKRQAPRDGTS
jgi:apolipoprotein N-acyltransferase